MMDRAEVRDTLAKADELVTELKAFRNLSPESGNVTQFTVNAGGIGVWVSVTACLMMVVLSVVLLASYLDIRAEQRETAAHLRTIYMLVPDLRELVNKNLNPAEKPKE